MTASHSFIHTSKDYRVLGIYSGLMFITGIIFNGLSKYFIWNLSDETWYNLHLVIEYATQLYPNVKKIIVAD